MRAVTLKLNDVSAYMTKIGRHTESPPLQMAGIWWHILVYPSVVDKITYLSCYLVGENARKWTAWVDATFRIVNANGGFGNELSFRKVLMGKTPLGDSEGWKEFIMSEELLRTGSGFVVDDCMEIRAEISLTDVCGTSLDVFDIPGALAADIRLKVGDSVFYANKGYLSVVSSVFRDMFALAEATEGKKETEEIELKDLDAIEFKEFLGVVYPSRYPITDANVASMFRIAERYDVQRVAADCMRPLLGAYNVPCFDKLKLTVYLHRRDLRNQLIATMNWADVEAFHIDANRDELGMDVVLAVVERHKLLSAARRFATHGSVRIRVDSSVADVCGSSFNAFETAGTLAADIKLKVGHSVFYANKGYLSVVSTVFRDLFAFTEADEAKKAMEEIELKDLDAGEFKEFLGVIYPTWYPITDINVIALFRIADRYDVKRVIADCEYHLYGVNGVPWFDKLKLVVDLHRDQLKKHLISKMTCDNIRTIDQDERKEQLGMDVLQALLGKHIGIHHS
ncbi:Protein BATH-7 [Aphelenchoides avenae]|nr:Protein BATH-7 [Aphelenchus avenae]